MNILSKALKIIDETQRQYTDEDRVYNRIDGISTYHPYIYKNKMHALKCRCHDNYICYRCHLIKLRALQDQGRLSEYSEKKIAC